jgi:hypothetical protein
MKGEFKFCVGTGRVSAIRLRSSHIRLGLPNDIFTLVSRVNILSARLVSHMHATPNVHLIILLLKKLSNISTIFVENENLGS